VDGRTITNGTVGFYPPAAGGGLTIWAGQELGSTLLVNDDGPMVGGSYEQLFTGTFASPTLEIFSNPQQLMATPADYGSPLYNEGFLLTATTCSGNAPCINSPSDGASPQSQFVALSGTGTPGDSLNVLVSGNPVGSVIVDSEGNWEALPYVSPFGSSVSVSVQDQTSFDSSNTITVHPSQAFFPSPLPPGVYTQLLPLRKADIFIDGSLSLPQVTLFGANYTHTALYLGGDSDGTPWIGEAVTAGEAGIWGQVRSVPLEQSLLWEANRLSAFRPKSPLSGAVRSAIVSWANTITVQGLPYCSPLDLGLILAADVLYVAALPARVNLFLHEIYALTNSTSTFICSTLVWRAYWEGTGHSLDISQPNLMSAQPGSLLGTVSPGFIGLLVQPPAGCTSCSGSTFVVPETFARNTTLLSQIF